MPSLSLSVEQVEVGARQRDGSWLPILGIDRLGLPPGGQAAITGPSGAGKSSLLGVLAGIVAPQQGRVTWGDTDITTLSEKARDAWRRGSVGLIFQDFHLVTELDILSNILLPTGFARPRDRAGMRGKARALAAAMGLTDPGRRAGLLSRGEQQRTAIARALLRDPAIILADEPTASLDAANGRAVAELLVDTATSSGASLLVATHDPDLISRLGRRWTLAAGRVEGDLS